MDFLAFYSYPLCQQQISGWLALWSGASLRWGMARGTGGSCSFCQSALVKLGSNEVQPMFGNSLSFSTEVGCRRCFQSPPCGLLFVLAGKILRFFKQLGWFYPHFPIETLINSFNPHQGLGGGLLRINGTKNLPLMWGDAWKFSFLCPKCGSLLKRNLSQNALELISIRRLWNCTSPHPETVTHEDYFIFKALKSQTIYTFICDDCILGGG